MLERVGTLVRKSIGSATPWTNVYGVARTLLAISTASTLALNSTSTLFRPIAGVPAPVPYCQVPAQQVGVFCLSHGHVDLARWVCVALLLVVASGWRPRVTAPLHWWISASFQASASTLDGGDQAAAVLTLLLLPIALTDGRKWQWTSPREDAPRSEWRSLVALSALAVVRLQVAAIYFHAAVAKMKVTEWADGTALYYWFTHPTFGGNKAVMVLLRPIIESAFGVTTLTWSVIIFEFALTMGLFATRPVRRVLLPLGIAFHSAIILIHGLASFALTMFAALILYLRPTDEAFELRWWRALASWRRRVVGSVSREPFGLPQAEDRVVS